MPSLLPQDRHITVSSSRCWNTRLLNQMGYRSFCNVSYKSLQNLAYFAYFTPDSPFFRPAVTIPEKFMQTNVKCAQKQNPRYGVDRLVAICQCHTDIAAVMIRSILMGAYPGTVCASVQQRRYLMRQTDLDLAKHMYKLLHSKLNKSDIMLFTVAFAYILLSAFHMSTQHLLYSDLVPFCEWFTTVFFSTCAPPRPPFPDQIVKRQLYPNPLITLISNTTLYFNIVDVDWPISQSTWDRLGMSKEGVDIFNEFMFGHTSFVYMKTHMSASDLYIIGSIVGSLFYSLPKVTRINQDSRSSYVVFCMHCRTINSAVNIHKKRIRDKLTPLVDLNSNEIVCSICFSKQCSVVQIAGNAVTFPTASVPWKNNKSVLEVSPTTKVMCPRCCRTMDIGHKICRMCLDSSSHNPACHYNHSSAKKRPLVLSSVYSEGRHLVLCQKHKQQFFSNQHVSGPCG